MGWYLVGLSIGLVFLVFFLKKKSGEEGIDFCYLPNCRVLKNMRSKTLTFGEALPEAYRDTTLILKFLTDGDVDFGKSNTKSKPCKLYFVEKGTVYLKIKNCSNKIVVEDIWKD